MPHSTKWFDIPYMRSGIAPLRITANFATGVVCDEYLPLDGIIRYQVQRDRLGHRDFSLPGGEDPSNMEHQAMPIIRRRISAEWYFMCSFAQPAKWWAAEGVDHWVKRFDTNLADLVDFDNKRGVVVIEKGQYKAYHNPYSYRVAEKCHWFCMGDGDEIKRLLSTVTHVGKKQSYGWGRVSRWEVEQWHENCSEWIGGKPARAIPAYLVDNAHEFNQRHYGVRPPYYGFKQNTRCVVP